MLGRPERGSRSSGPLRPQRAKYPAVLDYSRPGAHAAPPPRRRPSAGTGTQGGKRRQTRHRLQAAGETSSRPCGPQNPTPKASAASPRTQPRPLPLAVGAGPLSWPERIRPDSDGGGASQLATISPALTPRPRGPQEIGAGRGLAWRGEEQGCLGGQSPGGPGCGGMKPPPSGAESFKYGLGPGTLGAVLGFLREGCAR